MAEVASKRFEAIAATLSASSKAVQGKMFGMPTLWIGGKAFAGQFHDAMVFKLGGQEHARALALSGAKLFDPSGRRPMREWIEVPPKHERQWGTLATQALQYVSKATGPKRRTTATRRPR